MGVTVREKNKGSGVWWVFIRHSQIPGGRVSRRIGAKNVALKVAEQIDAKIKLGQIDFAVKVEKGKGVAVKANKVKTPTFSEYQAYFMQTYSKTNHKKSTATSYNEIIKNHLIPVFGNKKIDEIKRTDVKTFLYSKQKTHSPKTTHICRQYLTCILGQAVDDEVMVKNPALKTAKYVRSQEISDDEVKTIDPLSWQEKELFESIFNTHFPKYYVLIITALRTGMRIGELIALKPKDIDFNSSYIFVRRNAVRGEFGTPKNGKGRKVKMSPQLIQELKKHLATRKKETLKKGWGEPPEYLFYNDVGGLIDVNNFRKRVFYKALEKAGLRGITPHDLRHTYATLRIKAGHNIADVSKALGHSSIKITIDTYYHDIPDGDNSEVADLDLKSGTQINKKGTPMAPKKKIQ